jgi:hypothetical protein
VGIGLEFRSRAGISSGTEISEVAFVDMRKPWFHIIFCVHGVALDLYVACTSEGEEVQRGRCVEASMKSCLPDV